MSAGTGYGVPPPPPWYPSLETRSSNEKIYLVKISRVAGVVVLRGFFLDRALPWLLDGLAFLASATGLIVGPFRFRPVLTGNPVTS